jgi:hypothetical protein
LAYINPEEGRVYTSLLDYSLIFHELLFFILTALTTSNLTRTFVLRLEIHDSAKVEENSSR